MKDQDEVRPQRHDGGKAIVSEAPAVIVSANGAKDARFDSGNGWGGAAGCSPFVPVTNVAAVDPQTRAAAIQVRVLPLGMQLPAGTKILQPVQAYSCKHLMTDPPATQGDAMQQLQLRALELKANAVVNVTFDTRGTDTFGTNCWQTVTASGFAASLP
jgi:hypothetical protein